MKNWKKWMSVLLCGCMLFSLGACGSKDKVKEPQVLSRGRYVEVDISPTLNMGERITSFENFGKGRIDLISSVYDEKTNMSTFRRFLTEDDGKTWKEIDMAWTKEYIFDYNAVQDKPQEEWPEIVKNLYEEYTFFENGDLGFTISTLNRLEETSSFEEMKINMAGEITELDNNLADLNIAIKEKYGENATVNERKKITDERMFISLFMQPTQEQRKIAEETNNWAGLFEDKMLLLNTDTLETVIDFKENFTGNYMYITYRNLYVLENKLYVTFSGEKNEMKVYDIDTGKVLADEPVLSEEILNKALKGAINGMDGGSLFIGADGAFYSVGSTGVDRYNIQDGEIKQIMDGLNYTFGSPIMYQNYCEMNIDMDFLFSVSDVDNNAKLLRYVYDEQAIAETDSVVKVFALYESATVRLALSQFKREHPEVTIKLELGFTREQVDETYRNGTQLNAEDVIRALNTEILAGKGPDVLVLDGLPIESYIKQGVLEDLSAIVTDKNLRTNFIEPLKSKNKLYFAPLNVKLPVLIGDKEVVSQVTDLESFKTAILAGPTKELEEPNWETATATEEEIQAYYDMLWQSIPKEEQPIWGVDDIGSIFNFYSSGAPFIIKNQEGVDETYLRQYLEISKAISDKYKLLSGYGSGEMDDEEFQNLLSYLIQSSGTGNNNGMSGAVYSYLENRTRTGIMDFGSFDELWQIDYNVINGGSMGRMMSSTSISSTDEDSESEENGEDGAASSSKVESSSEVASSSEAASSSGVGVLDADMPTTEPGIEVPQPDGDVPKIDPAMINSPYLKEPVFLPYNMLGVCSTSQNKAMAKELVSVAFSMEVQKYGMNEGLPVLIEAFDYLKDRYKKELIWTNEGKMVEKPVVYDFDSIINNAATAYIPDEYLQKIIYSAAFDFMQEKISLDEAVIRITDETRTYFGEQK